MVIWNGPLEINSSPFAGPPLIYENSLIQRICEKSKCLILFQRSKTIFKSSLIVMLCDSLYILLIIILNVYLINKTCKHLVSEMPMLNMKSPTLFTRHLCNRNFRSVLGLNVSWEMFSIFV